MAARLNNDAASCRRAADNLRGTVQIAMSGEQRRQTVLADGRDILVAQQPGSVETSFKSNGRKHWMWCISSAVLTVFYIATSRSRAAHDCLSTVWSPQTITPNRKFDTW